ncbi:MULTISPECIES: ABC transporter permease [Flavobacterium]|uniref:ABC transporter permease n=1 Tax=Flavobacterium hankyongi TaxID=1176532 RepID=A0ABP9A0F9_9FLAO|nr:FtsX-like permease family protein [Flavobacterium sp. N1846]
MIAKLAWRNIWFKPLNTLLSVLLLSSSVAIITLLILLQKQFEEQFSSNADNIDLVLGAQGSPLQLILSSVYQVDAPTGNINYDSARVWMRHPFIKSAIPLAYGDNYLGYKIVGTTPDYLQKFNAKIEKGKIFKKEFEVVVGHSVATKLNLKVGDKFNGTHGDAKEGEQHEEFQYLVVGISSRTGRVIDNLILSNIESVWAMHGHSHEESEEIQEEPKEITSVLLKFRNKMGIVTWPRIIVQNTKMQAASPAIEINRLFTLFGIGLKTLEYMAYGIMLISGVSIFIALFNRLKEKEYEFALMRLHGASRIQILSLVISESLFLCAVGYFFGTIIGRVVLRWLSSAAAEDFKMEFNPIEIIWDKESCLFMITLLVGVVAALIPAIRAYRMNISKTLANG